MKVKYVLSNYYAGSTVSWRLSSEHEENGRIVSNCLVACDELTNSTRECIMRMAEVAKSYVDDLSEVSIELTKGTYMDSFRYLDEFFPESDVEDIEVDYEYFDSYEDYDYLDED